MIDITLAELRNRADRRLDEPAGAARHLGAVVRPVQGARPVLEKLEADYAGRFKLAKLNADEQPEIASS